MIGDQLTVSVAMGVFNGERFVEEQLRSIAEQTHQPDEVIIWDDHSTDLTTSKIAAWIQENEKQFQWQLHRQPVNVGIVENFTSAIAGCRGDVIILSDQDDRWLSTRIERTINQFQENHQVGLVLCNAALTDDGLRPLGETLWDVLRFLNGQREQFVSQHCFDLLLRRFLVTGAVTAFRRQHVADILPMSPYLLHDAWIGLIIASVAQVGLIDESLVGYRQHGGQQVGEGAKMRNLWTQFQTARQMKADWFERQTAFFGDVQARIYRWPDRWRHAAIGTLIDQKVQHCRCRIEIRRGGPPGWAALLAAVTRGDYRRFDYGWKSIAQDLFL